MDSQNPWLIIAEEGYGNVKTYKFWSLAFALDRFGCMRCSRILVDPTGREVSAKSGLNAFALGRVRSKMPPAQPRPLGPGPMGPVLQEEHSNELWSVVAERSSALRSAHAKMHNVVINSTSGQALEMSLPASTTISEIKCYIEESSWKVVPDMQTILVDTMVVEDDETVGALTLVDDASELQLTMISNIDSMVDATQGLRWILPLGLRGPTPF